MILKSLRDHESHVSKGIVHTLYTSSYIIVYVEFLGQIQSKWWFGVFGLPPQTQFRYRWTDMPQARHQATFFYKKRKRKIEIFNSHNRLERERD